VIQDRALRLLILGAITITGGVAMISSSNAAAGGGAGVEPAPIKVESLDPALSQIVPEKPVLEKVATGKGFSWTEGPIWTPSGYLLFAEIPSNSIRKWTPGSGTSVFLQPSGWKDSAPYTGKEQWYDVRQPRTAHGGWSRAT